MAASACVGWCSRTRTRGGKQSQGSCAMHGIRTVPCSLTSLFSRCPGQRLFGKLSADPQQCPTVPGQPLIPRARHRRGRVAEPSGVCSFAFVLPWPLLLRGRGRVGRSRRAAPVAGCEAGQGRFLKAGTGGQRPEQRAERSGAGLGHGGHRREVSAELPGPGMRLWPPSAPLPGRRRGPGGGMAAAPWEGVRSPLNFVHVSENCFGRKGRCRVSAIEGRKPGRRRIPWASGKG